MKKIGLFMLLIMITCFIVFVPPFISGQNERNITNKTTYRNYYASNRPKITSEQVARLYYNREINFDFNLSYLKVENSDIEIVRKDVAELIDMLFAENELIQKRVKKLLTNSDPNYFRNSSLIKVNNQPTAINFVSCGIKNEKGYLEIDYEEKTKTVVQFSCYIFDETFENFKDMDLYLDGTSHIANNYYKKQLNLSENEYYSTLSIVPMDEGNDSNHITRFYVNCGIAQQDDKIVYEIEKNTYN